MSLFFVCIECGLGVENLLVEYGEKNFRLTRCSHCGHVADKYIECELLLVLLEIFLHREPAFRHLMFNRYHPTVSHRAVRWMTLVLLIISMALQLIVLRHTLYRKVHVFSLLLAITASLFELFTFSVVFILYTLYQMKCQSVHTSYVKSFTRLYLSIIFPEVFRAVAIVLYMFDSQADLLLLISLLIASLQLVSYRSCTNLKWGVALGGMLLANLSRITVLKCFYRSQDLWSLGVFT